MDKQTVVIGPMIMIIGLSLASSAVSNIGLGGETIEWKTVAVAAFTFLVTAIVAVRGKGFLKVIPFLSRNCIWIYLCCYSWNGRFYSS